MSAQAECYTNHNSRQLTPIYFDLTDMPTAFRVACRTRHTTVFRVADWSPHLVSEPQWLVLFVYRVRSKEYSSMAAGEDTDPIPPDVATSAALGARAYRRVDTCVTVTTGEVVVHNEFYACKFRAAFENRFGTSWLTPAVLVHPSMKIADDSRRSVALRNAEGRLKDGERRGRTRSVTPGEGRCVALNCSTCLTVCCCCCAPHCALAMLTSQVAFSAYQGTACHRDKPWQPGPWRLCTCWMSLATTLTFSLAQAEQHEWTHHRHSRKGVRPR